MYSQKKQQKQQPSYCVLNQNENEQQYVICTSCNNPIEIVKIDLHEARCKKFNHQKQQNKQKNYKFSKNESPFNKAQKDKNYVDNYYVNNKKQPGFIKKKQKDSQYFYKQQKNHNLFQREEPKNFYQKNEKIDQKKMNMAKANSYGNYYLKENFKQENNFRQPPTFSYSNKKTRQQQKKEKVQCLHCGRLQPISLIEIHELQCQKLSKCKFCLSFFPQEYMIEHFQVCQKNNKKKKTSNLDFYKFNNKYQQYEYERQYDNIQYRNKLFQFPFFKYGFHNRDYKDQGQWDWNTDRKNLTKQQRKMIANLAQKAKHQKKGLTKKEINYLKVTQYKRQKPSAQSQKSVTLKQSQDQETDNGEICPICYIQFIENQPVIHLKCKHTFHQQCVKKWLQINASCPTCKKEL